MEFLTISDLEKREISKKKPIALGGVVSKLHGPTQIEDYDWRYPKFIFYGTNILNKIIHIIYVSYKILS